MTAEDIEHIGSSKLASSKADSDKPISEVVEGIVVTVTNEDVCSPWPPPVNSTDTLCRVSESKERPTRSFWQF